MEISQEYNHSESAFIRTVRNKVKLVPVDTVAWLINVSSENYQLSQTIVFPLLQSKDSM